MNEPRPIGAVVGDYVRDFRRRHRISKDELATQGAIYGMNWGRTSIDNIERAKSALTIPTLFALCNALSDLAPRESREHATISAIFGDDEQVVLSGEFAVSGATLKGFLQDDEKYPLLVGDTLRDAIRDLIKPANFTLAERRAARTLGITPDELRAAAVEIWDGYLLDHVVTQTVGPDASPQTRGHATRRLIADLRQHIEKPSNG